MIRLSFTAIVYFLMIGNAYAYVGPGLGLGVLGAIVGAIVSIVLAIVGVIWYPLRRIFKKRKSQSEDIGKNLNT